MKRRASAVGLGSAIAFLASFAFAGEAPARFEVNSFAEVASPGTLLYVEVPDFARAREAYRRTPRGTLWWEGAGRRLISEWIRAEGDEEFTSFMRAFAEALKVVEGGLAYAMEIPAGDETDVPGSVLLAEAGERAAELEGLLGRMADVEVVEQRERTIGGVRFAEMDEFLLLGRAGGLVIGGVGRPAMEGLLARFDERPWQSLAASRAFRMARERVGGGSDFFCFANFGELWKLLRMDMTDDEVAAFTRSGLTQLTAVAQGGRFTREGVVDRLTFILSGRARGMWKLLAPEPLSRATWKALPEFTSGFVSIKLPLAERAAPFREMLRSMDPDLEGDFVEPFADFREETGVSFDGDLLPLTTGEVTFVCLDEPEGGIEPRRGEDKSFRLMLLAVELADPAAARAVMDRFTRPFGMNDALGRKWRFGNLDGWEVRLDRQTKFCVAGTRGVAYIALAPEPIERLARHLEGKGRMLVDTPEFREATAWIPRESGFVGYSNVSKVLASLHKLVAATGEEEAAARPPLEELLKGLTPLTAALRVEEPGFTFEVRSSDGFWPFYLQLMAHFLWRFEEEPVQARMAELERRRRADPGYAAGIKVLVELRARVAKIEDPAQRIAAMMEARHKVAGTEHAMTIDRMIRRERAVIARGERRDDRPDAELAKAYSALRKRIAKVRSGQLKIVVLEAALPKFRGTRYEAIIKAMIRREKTLVVRAAFTKTLQAYNKIKRPADKVAFLETRLPRFAGTAYERTLRRLIERERAKMAPPVPEPEEPDDVF